MAQGVQENIGAIVEAQGVVDFPFLFGAHCRANIVEHSLLASLENLVGFRTLHVAEHMEVPLLRFSQREIFGICQSRSGIALCHRPEFARFLNISGRIPHGCVYGLRIARHRHRDLARKIHQRRLIGFVGCAARTLAPEIFRIRDNGDILRLLFLLRGVRPEGRPRREEKGKPDQYIPLSDYSLSHHHIVCCYHEYTVGFIR